MSALDFGFSISDFGFVARAALNRVGRFVRKSEIRNRKSETVLALALLLISGVGTAQTATTKGEAKNDTVQPVVAGKPKVLFVPFNTRMYMSEIDMTINRETSLNYRQIRDGFRSGLNKSLMQAFRKSCNVVSLLDDTVKMKKDLAYVYEVTTLSYDPVNGAAKTANAQAKQSDPKNPPKSATSVKNGQVMVQTDDQEKFMNTLIMSPNLLGYLKKKYNADYIVFVNELDLKNELGDDPYNLSGTQQYKRSASVHYTIVATASGKRVASGKAKSLFASDTNKPQKIIDNQFSSISKSIFEKFETGRK